METSGYPSDQEGPSLLVSEGAPLAASALIDNTTHTLASRHEANPGRDDGSVSDVSMAEESDDEDFYGQSSPRPLADDNATASCMPQPSAAGEVGPGLLSRKRKSPVRRSGGEDDEGFDGKPTSESVTGPEQNKKVKLDGDHGISPSVEHRLLQDRSLLPAEIWHHIFNFCPPKTLGNLLSVNKLFHSWLDSSPSTACIPQQASEPLGVLRLLEPNSLWKASRKNFWPGMPTPLKSRTELGMWKLVCSLTCEHCGKKGTSGNSPFACPTPFGPGMDDVAIVWRFATRACGPCLLKNSVKEIDLLLSSSTPSKLSPAIPFVYLTEQLDIVPSNVINRGKLPQTSPATRFYSKVGVDAIKQEFFTVSKMGSATTEEWLKGLEGRGLEIQNDSARWENYASSGGVSKMRSQLYPGYRQKSDLPRQLPSAPESRSNSDGTTPSGHSSLRAAASDRHERTREEISELIAARRAEIERRAMLLDPPIKPSVLELMEPFQAALQLITPLDDRAWELLKPRLISQRVDAEQQEAQKALANGKEATDSDWDAIQGPLRAQIAGFADDIIRTSWDDGEDVTKDTCGKFAADVLLHVRKQFYAAVAKDAAAARAAGKRPVVDPPRGPYTQKLTLENMKWIFDTKIRPLTEPRRRELFLCNGCEHNVKYYGFEGVIQHYAAKHTTALSAGNIVVHWRAEWPEVPPFHPNPRSVKLGQYQGTTAPTFLQYGHAPYSANTPVLPAHSQPQPQSGYQQPYGIPPYGDPYVAPPPVHPAYPHANGYGAPPVPPQQPQVQPGYGPAPYQPPAAPYQGYPPGAVPPGPYPPQAPASGPVPGGTAYGAQATAPPLDNAQAPPPVAYDYNYGAYQNNGGYSYPAAPGPVYPDRYRTQLEDVAKNARELWNATANIKDLHGSVRLHVVIHHVAKRFLATFSELAPLSMFNDGLSNNKDMRPVRNVNGLVCKSCHNSQGGAPVHTQPHEQERKTFSLPQLTNHFQSTHIEPIMSMGQHVTIPDWTTEMILLPDMSSLTPLRMSVGTDTNKYHLLSEALPQLFQAHPVSSHPVVGPAHQPLAPETQWPPIQNEEPNQQPSVDRHDRFYGAGSGVGGNNVNSASANGSRKFPNGGVARGDAGRKSNQGSHQTNFHQQGNDKNKKKSTLKGQANNNQSRKGDKGSGGNRGGPKGKTSEVNDAEAKRAEEEQRRQEEEIRAMWAADRAQMARQQTTSATTAPNIVAGVDKPGQSGADKVSRPNAAPAPYPTQEPRLRSPQPVQRQKQLLNTRPAHPAQRAPSRPDREGSDPMAALDRYLEEEHNRSLISRAAQPAEALPRDAWPRDAQPREPPPREALPREAQSLLHSSAVYVDDRLAAAPPRAAREQHHSGYSSFRVEEERRRSTSPVYVRYLQQPPPEHYRERSPPQSRPIRQLEPVYHTRQAPHPDEEMSYERVSRPREVYRVYADDRRLISRPVDHEPYEVPYEAYEVVKVQHPDGDYYVKRSVVMREPEQRYYTVADPYELERSHRGERPLYLEERTHREVEPVYMAQPYEQRTAISASSYLHRPPTQPPPSSSARQAVYSQQVYESSAVAAPAQAPVPPSSREHYPAHISRADPAYYEEYDPHFPAAAAPPPPSSAPVRQYRY